MGLPQRALGRYTLYAEIAAGGMATVHYARQVGAGGFARTVAIKRLHPQYAKDPEFVDMFLDEARLAARIHHPNVVQTLDVVASEGELFVVMEYVHGESLSRLIRASRVQERPIPLPIVSAIIVGMLNGLHSAHEAKDEKGKPLGLVHRDVSPHNVLVGTDGASRALDFGVAKAASRMHTTQEGQIKGKLPYMAPEQLERKRLTRAADIWGATCVLWEALVGRRLFEADNEGGVIAKILEGVDEDDLPSKHAPPRIAHEISPELDALVMRGLAKDPAKRFVDAREMARALDAIVPIAAPMKVGEWVESIAAKTLASRSEILAAIESGSAIGPATAGRLVAAIPDEPDGATEPSADADAAVPDPNPPADKPVTGAVVGSPSVTMIDPLARTEIQESVLTPEGMSRPISSSSVGVVSGSSPSALSPISQPTTAVIQTERRPLSRKAVVAVLAAALAVVALLAIVLVMRTTTTSSSEVKGVAARSDTPPPASATPIAPTVDPSNTASATEAHTAAVVSSQTDAGAVAGVHPRGGVGTKGRATTTTTPSATGGFGRVIDSRK